MMYISTIMNAYTRTQNKIPIPISWADWIKENSTILIIGAVGVGIYAVANRISKIKRMDINRQVRIAKKKERENQEFWEYLNKERENLSQSGGTITILDATPEELAKFGTLHQQHGV
jgi:hypothetical protein